jgi:hypothetical protein
MKLKRKDKIEKVLKTLKVQHNDLYINYCGNYPIEIEKHFTLDDNLKSFPPNGKLEATELDFFYYILHKNSVVGFYRVTDLFFNNEIELHGSFNKYRTFLVKSYFELTRIFVTSVQNIFQNSIVSSSVYKDNKKAIMFLEFLGFELVEFDINNDKFLIFKITNKNLPHNI